MMTQPQPHNIASTNHSLKSSSVSNTRAPPTLTSGPAELQKEVGNILNHVIHSPHDGNTASPNTADASARKSSSFDDKSYERNSLADIEKQGPNFAAASVVSDAGRDATVGEKATATNADPVIVDWDGPDDPANPYNWSLGNKWVQGGLLSAMTLITPLASSAFAPGVPEVMTEFGTSSGTLASFVVSIYILGYAFGPLVIAPLSEIYGRRPIYHVTNVLFIIFTIACAVAGSFGQLVGFRFLAGLMGSTVITIGGGTIGDIFTEDQRGSAIALWSLGALFGPVLGPIAGSYLSQAKGWRWVFWLITILAGVVTVGMLVFIRETYAPVLLENKAKAMRKQTGNQELKSKLDSGLGPREKLLRSIVRPMKMLVRSPIVLMLSLYMAVVYGYLYLLFTTITEVFVGQYGFSSGSVGLAFLGIGIGMLLGLFVAGASSDVLLKKLKAKNGGVSKPEYRLPLMIPAAVILPTGLFIYGWTAQYKVQYVVPIFGTGLVGFGLIASFMPISTYLIDAFGIYSASALAANTVLRSICGALLPLAGPPMYAALGLGWGNSLLGFIALALAPVPVIFWRYGERIRTSKRFTVQF